MCRTQYASDKIYSPDGKYFVQIKDQSCGGATGDNTTNIFVADAQMYFTQFNFLAANIISAQTGNSTSILGAYGSGSSIKMSWENNRTLKIKLIDCGPSLGQDSSWRDIKIIYEGDCPTPN